MIVPPAPTRARTRLATASDGPTLRLEVAGILWIDRCPVVVDREVVATARSAWPHRDEAGTRRIDRRHIQQHRTDAGRGHSEPSGHPQLVVHDLVVSHDSVVTRRPTATSPHRTVTDPEPSPGVEHPRRCQRVERPGGGSGPAMVVLARVEAEAHGVEVDSGNRSGGDVGDRLDATVGRHVAHEQDVPPWPSDARCPSVDPDSSMWRTRRTRHRSRFEAAAG